MLTLIVWLLFAGVAWATNVPTCDQTPNCVCISGDIMTGDLGIGVTTIDGDLDVMCDYPSRSGPVWRTPTEVVNQGIIQRFGVGTDDMDVSTAIIADIRAIIQQADPSTLKGRLEFWVNQGDSMLKVANWTDGVLTIYSSTTGDGTIVLPNDSIGDAEVDFASVTCADMTMSDCGAIIASDLTCTECISAAEISALGTLTDGNFCQAGAGSTLDCDVLWDNDGDCTSNTVCLGGHGHTTYLVGTTIDTEAELETHLTDVTNVFTNNDGALTDDAVSLTDVQSACTNDFHSIGGTDDDKPDAGDLSTSDGVGSTSSGSGLEVDATSGNLGMLQGCSDGKILKWTEGTSIWSCADDGGSTITGDIIAGSGLTGGNADVIPGADTTLTVGAGQCMTVGADTVGVTADCIQGVDLADNISLDATMTIGDGVPTNYVSITAGGVVSFGGTGELRVPNTTASPDSVGEIKVDNDFANMDDTDALVWYDADDSRMLVDLDVGTQAPGTTDFIIYYNATTDKFEKRALNTNDLPVSSSEVYIANTFSEFGTYVDPTEVNAIAFSGDMSIPANQCWFSTTGLACEGATDAYEGLLSWSPTTKDQTLTIPDIGGDADGLDTFTLLQASQTLTNKTLTTPTIASFTNATHNHSNAAGGGDVALGSGSTGTKASAGDDDTSLATTSFVQQEEHGLVYTNNANTAYTTTDLCLGDLQACVCTSSSVPFACQHIVPKACTLRNLYAEVDTAVLTGSWVVTVAYMDSGSDTVSLSSLTCTISSGRSCNDTTHTQAITAGQKIAVFWDSTSVTSTRPAWSVICD